MLGEIQTLIGKPARRMAILTIFAARANSSTGSVSPQSFDVIRPCVVVGYQTEAVAFTVACRNCQIEADLGVRATVNRMPYQEVAKRTLKKPDQPPIALETTSEQGGRVTNGESRRTIAFENRERQFGPADKSRSCRGAGRFDVVAK